MVFTATQKDSGSTQRQAIVSLESLTGLIKIVHNEISRRGVDAVAADRNVWAYLNIYADNTAYEKYKERYVVIMGGHVVDSGKNPEIVNKYAGNDHAGQKVLL